MQQSIRDQQKMKKKFIAIVAAVPLLLSAWMTVNAQEEEDAPPYVTPVDTFTCNYNDGKGPDESGLYGAGTRHG